MSKLSFGISPCPNDTFIFHGLIAGLVQAPAAFDWRLEDVETLNQMAGKAELDVCKLSIGALSRVLDDYVVLRSGGAIGLGCGPILVAPSGTTLDDLKDAPIAVPGLRTTANALLSMYGAANATCKGERIPLRFDEIMPALQRSARIGGQNKGQNGKTAVFAAGLLIHEGRFTFMNYGLDCLLDLGQWWEAAFKLPLPLGVIVARRSLGHAMHLALERSFRQSLALAQGDRQTAWPYIKSKAQELEDQVIQEHIKTFVTDWSMDYGNSGQAAIMAFLERHAALRGAALPDLPVFVRD